MPLFRITGHDVEDQWFDKYTLAADFVEAAQKTESVIGVESITKMDDAGWID